MADSTYNAVERSIFEKNWTGGAKVIFMAITALCPNMYGVFEMPYFHLKALFNGDPFTLSTDEMNKILDELEAEGVLKLYDERKYVWLLHKWLFEQRNPSLLHRKGFAGHLNDQVIRRYHQPDMAVDIAIHYKLFTEDHFKHEKSGQPINTELRNLLSERCVFSHTQSQAHTHTHTHTQPLVRDTHAIPMPYPCHTNGLGDNGGVLSDDNEKKEAVSGSKEYISLVKELFPKAKDVEAQADAIRKVVEIHGAPFDELKPALIRARNDTGNGADWKGWRKVFKRCAYLLTYKDNDPLQPMRWELMLDAYRDEKGDDPGAKDNRRIAWHCAACKGELQYFKPGDKPAPCDKCGAGLSNITPMHYDELIAISEKRKAGGVHVTMRCPECEIDYFYNDSEARYCLACGMPLVPAATKYHDHRNRAPLLFCPACLKIHYENAVNTCDELACEFTELIPFEVDAYGKCKSESNARK